MFQSQRLDEIQENKIHVDITEDKHILASPFIEIQQDSGEQPIPPMPAAFPKWLKRLEKKRIGIFADQDKLDAYLLQRRIAFGVKAGRGYPVKEIIRHSEIPALIPALQREPNEGIFLLGPQSPESLGHDLEALYSLSERKNFWLLIQSNLDQKVWSNFNYAIDLSQPDYEVSDLEEYLGTALDKHWDALSERAFSPTLVEKFQNPNFIRKLCKQLLTPLQIDLFFQHLINQSGPVNEQALEFATTAALEQKHSPLIRSFKSQNEERKLIALGLVLFDGLYDDQFFSAMKYLVEKRWQGRTDMLRSLDYCDLEAVSSFFNYNNIAGDIRIIQHKSADQRRAIIAYAWNSYRRHLLSALPIMAELVILSATATSTNWELFGTTEKRRLLRSSIADTISDLGLKAPESVEHTLIQLAANRSYGVQRVAADALARWYKQGRRDLFFDLTDRWQRDDKFVHLAINILAERDPGKRNSRYQAMDYIKATIVLTLGKAAEFTPAEEKLDPKIITALDHALLDKSDLVKTRLGQILPEVVHHHLEELGGGDKLLLKFIDHDHLLYSVGLGIARAYRTRPELVKRLFSKWLPKIINHEWSDNKPFTVAKNLLEKAWKYISGGSKKSDSEEEQDEFTLENRDKRAIAMILACQEIIRQKQSDERIELHGKTPYEILFDFRATEKNIIVKAICMQTLVNLLKESDDEVSRHLLYKKDNLEEKRRIASYISRRYLYERHKLRGGEEDIFYRRRRYSIWINKSNRPPVQIEKIVFGWLTHGQSHQKQLALLALDQFNRVLDFREDREVERILKEQEAASREDWADTEPNLSIRDFIGRKINNFIYVIRKLWVTIFKSTSTTNTLEALAPILREFDFSADSLELISEKLERNGDVPEELIKGIEQLYKISD